MRILRLPTALVLAAALLSACGSSGAKRTLDAEAEALRFFAADAPLIALVDTSPGAGRRRAALVASLGGLPAWGSMRSTVGRQLAAAGIEAGQLRSLADDADPENGIPRTQLAVGMRHPGTAEQDLLTVLVTEHAEEMSRILDRAARSGRLAPAGELDDARLYVGQGAAFAVRDGVLLAAASPEHVRAAIKTRDGDRDEQIDDREVSALLDEVPEQPPLDVYANVESLAGDDPAIAALATPPAQWLRSLRKVVFAVRGTPTGVRIDAFGHIDEDTAAEEDSPLGAEPSRAAASPRRLSRLLEGGGSSSSPLHGLIVAMGPLQAVATVDGDEIRASARLAP